MSRYGVIDLGTNTFHVLIAEAASQGGLREIYRERRFIKLAEGGIKTIAEAPFRRGLEAVCDYRELLELHGAKEVRAVGTAALRTARNGPEFMQQIKQRTGIRVELISGEQEAALIYRGVAGAIPLQPEPYLIMDIGGGSVEFIIADRQGAHWATSLPIGLAVLARQFSHLGPMPAAVLARIHQWLDRQLDPLQTALLRFPVEALVGASGTFDVLEDMLVPVKEPPLGSRFSVTSFNPLYRKMLATSYEDRLAVEKLPASRADMFVFALILVDHLLQLSAARQVIISNYALKEGVLFEMIDRDRFRAPT